MEKSIPPISEALAIKIENAERNALLSRLTAIKEQEGNPMGVEIITMDGITLFSIKGIPGPSYNKVIGLHDRNKKNLDEIIAFYHDKNIVFQIDVIPADTSNELFKALANKGLYQSSFHTTLYGIPYNTEKINKEITVKYMDEIDFHHFGEIYTKAFHMPDFLQNGIIDNNKVLLHHESWKFYVAKVNDEAASIAVYFQDDEVSVLAAAATLPHYENKGCHHALINARIQDAFENKSDLIIGQARFGSVSQQNMQKMGMQVAYTKSIWTKF